MHAKNDFTGQAATKKLLDKLAVHGKFGNQHFLESFTPHVNDCQSFDISSPARTLSPPSRGRQHLADSIVNLNINVKQPPRATLASSGGAEVSYNEAINEFTGATISPRRLITREAFVSKRKQ